MLASLRHFPRFSRARVLGVVLAFSIAPSLLQASSREETLDAIHRVENPQDLTRPGKHGELGAYQFRRGTWRMYTKVPFERALDRSQSEEIAIQHYEWLRRGLARNGLPQTPYYIALAWNGGLASVVNGRSSRSSHDYAARVSNLVVDLRTSGLALAP